MYKVVIIDDEPIIRKGFKNIIDWKLMDCEVCGEADDGQSGRELIEKHRPDIIITDIKMPEVDGLTMIRAIKQIVPDSKIIILTGYRNFDYARTAVKLGAFDYIMKPSKIEELNSVIQRAVSELKNRTENSMEMEKLREQYEKSKPLLRERLLYNLLYGLFDQETDIAQQAGHIGLKTDRYLLGIVENEIDETSGPDEPEEEPPGRDTAPHLYQFGIISTLQEIFSEDYSITCLPLGSRRIAFVLSPKGDGELDPARINDKCVYLQKIIFNCFNFTVTCALSSEGSGYESLPQKLRECHEALEHKFYIGNNSIIFHSDLDAFFKYEDLSGLYDLQKQLLDNIKSGNVAAVRATIGEILGCVNATAGADREYIRNYYFYTITLIHSVKSALPIEGISRNQGSNGFVSLYSMIEKCDNLCELNGLLEEVSVHAVEKVREYNDNNMKQLLRRAVDYLNEHYREDITLNQVAEHIYVSTFYISRMFKKELGINFIDYLNELRISKAKELLADARYKAYEVADAVGISNAHYFSRLFRKYTGMTASEYKESVLHGTQIS